MDSSPHPFWVSFSHWVQHQIKGWLRPTTVYLAMGAIADLSRSKADLIVENTLLRQQLIVLNRQVKRPKLTNGDRIRLVLLARCTKFWNQALRIIQPDTLLRWHRDLFRLYWRHISSKGKKKERLALETIMCPFSSRLMSPHDGLCLSQPQTPFPICALGFFDT